jgi:hypothetical protein
LDIQHISNTFENPIWQVENNNAFSTYLKCTIISKIYFVIQSKLLKGWKYIFLKGHLLWNSKINKQHILANCKIDKVVTRSSILLIAIIYEEPLNLFFKSYFSCDILLQNGLWCHNYSKYFILLLFILELLLIYNLFELPKKHL